MSPEAKLVENLLANLHEVCVSSTVTSFQSLKIDQAQFLVPAANELPRVLRIGVRFSF